MGLYKKLRPLLRQLSQLQIGLYAANASFFLLVSLFPLAILILTLLQYVPVSQGQLLDFVAQIVPKPLLPFFVYLTQGVYPGSSAARISLSAAVTLWSASKGLLSLLQGLNAVARVEDSRSYLHRRGLCMLYTLATLVALVLTLLLQVFGGRLLGMAAGCGIRLPRLALAVLDHLQLYALVVLTLFFSALYLALPDRKQRFSQVWPGALAAAGAWNVFSWGFSFYVNHISGYSALYGGLSILLLTLLWLYFCMSILFYGAFVNNLLFDRQNG